MRLQYILLNLFNYHRFLNGRVAERLLSLQNIAAHALEYSGSSALFAFRNYRPGRSHTDAGHARFSKMHTRVRATIPLKLGLTLAAEAFKTSKPRKAAQE
jgi:hypothetical protein